MQIDSTNNTPRVGPTELREVKSGATARTASDTKAEGPRASAQYQASAATDGSQDIDAARVAEVRQAISEGKFEIKPERIADGIIASAREMLGESP